LDLASRALRVSLLLLYVAFVLAPVFLMFLGSFGQRWFGTLLPEGFTLEWYLRLFSEPMYYRALLRSLLVGALTLVLGLLVCVPAAYAVVVLENRWVRYFYEFLVILPIAIPPVVLGLGLIQAYNVKGLRLVGSWQLLVLAHVLYTLPFMLKPLVANMEMISWKVLEEAARSLGAGLPTTFRRVLLPNLVPGILSGALMTFTISLGEFQLAVILTSSLSQTFPVVLYQAFYVSTGFACAATTLLTFACLFALVAVMALSRGFSGYGNRSIW